MKRYAPLVLLILGFAFLFFSSLDSHGGLMWDEAEYANLGRDIRLGRSYGSHFRPPVLPLAVAATMAVTGREADSVVKVPVALAGLAGLALLYVFLCLEFDEATAIVGAGCLGAMPGYWIHTSFLLSEVPFLVFFAGAYLSFVKGLYGSSNWFLATWSFTGLAFLTRYTCVLLGPVFLLSLILGAMLDKRVVLGKLKDKKFWVAPFLGLAIQVPWLLHQYLQHGDPLVGFHYAAGQLQRYMPGVSMPVYFYLQSMPSMLTIPILVLTLLGIGWVVKSRNRVGLHLLLVAAFLLCWFSAYRYKEFRLITAILPFLAALAGLGYGRVVSRLWVGLSQPWVAVLVVAATAFYSNTLLAPFFRQNRALGYPSLKETAERLTPYFSTDSVIMVAPSPQFAWYTGKKTVGFPERDQFYEKLAKVDFVVVVTYERGQPKYAGDLVAKLFPEPEAQSHKYFVVSDQFQNLTFVTSGAEFRRRLELQAQQEGGEP